MKKKVLRIMLMMLILLSIATISKAGNVGITVEPERAEVERGTDLKVSIRVTGFTREGTQKAIEGKLVYDKSKLEYKSKSAQNDWSLTMSGDHTGFVATKDETVTSSEIIAEITFTVKEGAELGDTEITIEDVLTSSDGDEEGANIVAGGVEIIAKVETPTGGGDGGNGSGGNEAGGNGAGGNEAGGNGSGGNEAGGNGTGGNGSGGNGSGDGTTAQNNYPYTGAEKTIVPVAAIATISIIAFIGYRKNRAF